MLLRDGKILLGKRHDDPEKADSLLEGAGTWTLPGGKLDFGDGFEQAACREVMEETGIKLKPASLKLVSVSNEIATRAQFVCLGFIAGEFQGEPRAMEPDEITRWEWFPLDSLPSPMFPASKKILKNYIAKEIYKHKLL